MTPPAAVVLLAAKLTAWEQILRIPKQTWINLAICIVAILVIVRMWRALKKVNDYAPYFAAVIAGFMIFFYWVYNRTEPAILTPVVERLAPFFPSRHKQQEVLEKVRRGRDM